jgi:hypothetical protein
MYLWFDFLVLAAILYVLIITHLAAFLVGRWLLRARSRHEVMRQCKHEALIFVEDIGQLICQTCGARFDADGKGGFEWKEEK